MESLNCTGKFGETFKIFVMIKRFIVYPAIFVALAAYILHEAIDRLTEEQFAINGESGNVKIWQMTNQKCE